MKEGNPNTHSHKHKLTHKRKNEKGFKKKEKKNRLIYLGTGCHTTLLLYGFENSFELLCVGRFSLSFPDFSKM